MVSIKQVRASIDQGNFVHGRSQQQDPHPEQNHRHPVVAQTKEAMRFIRPPWSEEEKM